MIATPDYDDMPVFDCACCGDETRGNGRGDEGSMLCRDCHLDFIPARGDTLEAKLANIGYREPRLSEVAGDMRALFAVRFDQEALTKVVEKIRFRDAMDCR